MKRTALTRRWLAGLAAACLLFAQMAVVAYACPAQAAMPADMPCDAMMLQGAGMDPAQPALCAEHCQSDAAQPAPDLTPSTAAFVPALALLFVVAPVSCATALEPIKTVHEWARERAPPQPHSVLHCCWRI